MPEVESLKLTKTIRHYTIEMKEIYNLLGIDDYVIEATILGAHMEQKRLSLVVEEKPDWQKEDTKLHTEWAKAHREGTTKLSLDVWKAVKRGQVKEVRQP